MGAGNRDPRLHHHVFLSPLHAQSTAEINRSRIAVKSMVYDRRVFTATAGVPPALPTVTSLREGQTELREH